jgi:hypothetical protein
MFLMSNDATLRALADILLGPRATAATRTRPPPEAVSDASYKHFRAWLSDYSRRRSASKPTDEEILANMPAGMRSDLSRLAARIIEEILKRPDAMH